MHKPWIALRSPIEQILTSQSANGNVPSGHGRAGVKRCRRERGEDGGGPPLLLRPLTSDGPGHWGRMSGLRPAAHRQTQDRWAHPGADIGIKMDYSNSLCVFNIYPADPKAQILCFDSLV